MAVFAFVFSLIGILASVAAWWIEIFPVALAVLALVVVSADKRRGRALAVWAIVIGLCAGSCAYVLHTGARQLASTLVGSVLSALASDATDEAKDDAIAPWMHPPTLETDIRQKIRERYARVTQEYGAYVHPPDVGGFFASMAPLIIPPEGIEEIGRSDTQKLPAPGSCFWVRTNFEKGVVVVSIELRGGKMDDISGMQGELEPGAPAPLVSDVRFFRVKGKQ